ncbi:MAG: VWA domain-containing protein [Nannocystaceae bacterium]
MTRSSRGRGLALALGLVAASSSGSSSAAPVEVAHEIVVDFGERAATLQIRRSVRSDEDTTHEAHLRLASGWPLVGAGLRTRGDDGRWYDATILPIDAAIATYWMLTGSEKVAPDRELGPRLATMTPRDPALMMWSPSGLEIYAFPVAAGQPRTVEARVIVPYHYFDGAYVAHVPVGDQDTLAPTVRVGAIPAGHRVSFGGREWARGEAITAVPADDLALRLVGPERPPLALRLASTPAGDRHLLRLEVEVGERLGPDPKDTHAVILLDRSRSITDEGAEAADEAALGYLSALAEVPGARAQVVRFDRTIARAHDRFVAPEAAAEALRDPPALANGSDLAGALAVAEGLLRSAPPGAPRRVLVLSDAAIAPEVDAAVGRALASLRAARVIVHLADVAAERFTSLEVDAEHRLRGPVAATGGQVWRARMDVVRRRRGDVFAEWVRPRLLHDLEVVLDGEGLAEIDLAAGQGSIEVDLRDFAPRRASARGWAWSLPVAVTARRRAADDRAWSAIAAAYVDDRLSDAELLDLGTRGGVVTPATALLALEPGAKPGVAEPLPRPPPRVRSSRCGYGGSGGSFGRFTLEFDEGALLRGAFAEAARACHVGDRPVRAEVTTTYAEIVGVEVAVDDDEAASTCVRERLWAVEFPTGRHAVVRHDVGTSGAG